MTTARDAFYDVLSATLPQDAIDGIWQKIGEAGIEVMAGGPLSNAKFLEYLRGLNEMPRSPAAGREGLLLIKAICEDSSTGSSGRTTALDIIWQITAAALSSLPAPPQGGAGVPVDAVAHPS